jgi:hypothetical protein
MADDLEYGELVDALQRNRGRYASVLVGACVGDDVLHVTKFEGSLLRVFDDGETAILNFGPDPNTNSVEIHREALRRPIALDDRTFSFVTHLTQVVIDLLPPDR